MCNLAFFSLVWLICNLKKKTLSLGFYLKLHGKDKISSKSWFCANLAALRLLTNYLSYKSSLLRSSLLRFREDLATKHTNKSAPSEWRAPTIPLFVTEGAGTGMGQQNFDLKWSGKVYHLNLSFPCGSDGKESTCNAGDTSLVPELEDLLEKGVATHSSILSWRIP